MALQLLGVYRIAENYWRLSSTTVPTGWIAVQAAITTASPTDGTIGQRTRQHQ